MTIKAARAISATVAANLQYLDAISPDLYSDLMMYKGRMRFISIADPQIGPLYPGIPNTSKFFALQFNDIGPGPEDEHKTAEELGYAGCTLFTDEMAEEIVQFLLNAHKETSEPELLIVNCMMGVSRSGAVVDFARVVFQLSCEETAQKNPQIHPNAAMLRKLYRTWAKKS